MMKRALLLLLLLATLPASGTLGAQTPGREPAVLELPASTRAMALGGAYQIGALEPDLLFHNPSLVQRTRGVSLGLHFLGDGGLATTLAASTEWFGGGVGAGLQALEYEKADPGAGSREGGLDPLLGDGAHAVSEMAATAAYARRLFGVRVGIGGKLVQQRVSSARDVTFALDVGASREVAGYTLGFSVQDLGPSLEVNGRGRLPLRATLGAGRYGRQMGPLDVGAAAALTLRADRELVPGGGIEVGYWPIVGRTFVARVGARRVPEGDAFPVTFGGSYWGDRLIADYAFQPVDGEDGVHRITLGWR